MHTNDYATGIDIRHEADWSGYAYLSWSPTGGGNVTRIGLPGRTLVDGDPRILQHLPVHVALKVCSMAATAYAHYLNNRLHDAPSPRDEYGYALRSTCVLLDADLAQVSGGTLAPREPKRPVPLGWIDNVPITLRCFIWGNETTPRSMMFDIGKPDRDDHPFPRIARVAIPFAAVDELIRALSKIKENPSDPVLFAPAAEREDTWHGGEEPKRPVCSTCNDTHRVEFSGDTVMCTHCPVPCEQCRGPRASAYCEATPCRCSCHDLDPKAKLSDERE